jgi:hypothetical protein
MPRTKSDVQQAVAEQEGQDDDSFEPGKRVRVWWAPTDDDEKEGFAGMYWPVKILAVRGQQVDVLYDNGEEETVALEHLQPGDPPVDFGKEAVHLQVRVTCSICQSASA